VDEPTASSSTFTITPARARSTSASRNCRGTVVGEDVVLQMHLPARLGDVAKQCRVSGRTIHQPAHLGGGGGGSPVTACPRRASSVQSTSGAQTLVKVSMPERA
jgi:hypothetical protein